ncbi:acyltransferase [Rathayibacter sp. VKM Ac-2801]|uniref:acyltransferase family protein n=1 Tax=Rathayibacter sp. VKM Ac-2801 TaxID=2609255 RepID=UPI00131F6C32|nr:acyltransferase [Rathayibacter sp. VKM Ac-2801]QHC69329.1 acyltransferase family protein [Rathayibacter sp. VKM Ac-2801]
MTDSRTTAAVAKRPESREWIDFAKGVAISLVVLYHSSLFLGFFDLAGYVPKLRTVLLYFPMPVFFFIAGLTAARMLTWTFPELWRRRVLALVYLYLLWSLIRVVFYLIVPFSRSEAASPTDPLTVLVLPILPSSSYWFIWALAVFSILAWAIRKVPRWIQLSVAGLLAVAATTTGLLDTDNIGWDRVLQNFIFFLVAMFIPRTFYRFAARVKVWQALALAAAYLGIIAVIVAFDANRVPGVILIASSVAIIAGIAVSQHLVKVRALRIFVTLGQQSFQIYLLHLFVIAVVVAFVALLGETNVPTLPATIFPTALTVFSLWASLFLFAALRRFSWLWVSPFSTGKSQKKRLAAKDAKAAGPQPTRVESAPPVASADETADSRSAGTPEKD